MKLPLRPLILISSILSTTAKEKGAIVEFNDFEGHALVRERTILSILPMLGSCLTSTFSFGRAGLCETNLHKTAIVIYG